MRTIAAFAVALSFALSTLGAQAMPLAPTGYDDSMIAKAAYGCGPGMTRGPYGHCRPRFNCPWGFHPGPYGYHCFPN